MKDWTCNLAEFKNTLSEVDTDRFVSILEQEERFASSKPLSQESTAKKLDLGPVPCLPGRYDRKREWYSPILTGERARRQLAEQESRKQEREKHQEILADEI